MSRAEELAAKAARLRAAQTAATRPQPPAATPPPSSSEAAEPLERIADTQYLSRSVAEEHLATRSSRASTPQVRTRPVRLTVDVSPADHAALARLALEAAAELGLARVHGQEIVRALLHRMLGDPDLQRQIMTDIEMNRRTR